MSTKAFKQEKIEAEPGFERILEDEEEILSIIKRAYEFSDYIPVYDYVEMQRFASRIVKRVRSLM